MPVRRPAMGTFEVFERSNDAVVATDENGRIVIWNRAAERLLGYRADQVLGRPCSEVLAGADGCGNPFCRSDCELMGMPARRETVRRFEMTVRAASGRRVSAAFSILAVPGGRADEFTRVHLFRPPGHREPADRASRAVPGRVPLAPGALLLSLTPRELQILRSLDEGAGTREISEALGISATTVRTHVQHILHKLQVHSRLEAVAFAKRRRVL